MRLAAVFLAASLTGCAWFAQHEGGPESVDPELRLPLRLTVVGLHATMLLLYGGPKHDVFLGCLTCESRDPQSIFNPEAPYGKSSLERSIWNPHGPYGSRKSPYSPWNPTAAQPPQLRDEYDAVHGSFSVNPHLADRTRDPATIRFLKITSEAPWLDGS
ncbi:MAG: hypothetical protein JWM80_5909 [Cyanobacteria bacterium RYN_339]|nr:hypothetical protein [Cyanobacteria bacterium RYN_339]